MRYSRGRKIQSVEALLKQAMPPKYDVWEKLERAALEWESVAGPALAGQSAPLDLVNGELVVIAETPLIGNRVTMMRGNIIRILTERWGLEISKVRVVVGRMPLKSKSSSRSGGARTARASHVRVREEDVKEFESRCVESIPDFPQDAAASLARLRAFFMKRFGDKK